MAIVKQCDRCKAIYDWNKVRVNYVIHYNDDEHCDKLYAVMMLCDDCVKALEKFVKNEKTN